MTPKIHARKYPTPKLDLVDISSPEVFFAVQRELQKAGVILIDLSTGNRIQGQVNLPQIGLIILDKVSKPKKGFGFVSPLEQTFGTPHKKLEDVDATLFCEHFEPADGQPLMVIIQVVDHNFLEDWIIILNLVGNSLVTRVRGQLVPSVVFTITSLCAPDPKNPNSAKEAVLGKIQEYGFSGEVYAVSNDSCLPEDDYYDEDDESFDPD